MTKPKRSFFRKETADTVEGIVDDFHDALRDVPKVIEDGKAAVAKGLIAAGDLYKHFNMAERTNAGAALAKMGAVAGVPGGLVGVKIGAVTGGTIGLIGGKRAFDGINRFVDKYRPYNGGAEAQTEFQGPPTSNNRWPQPKVG